MVIVQLTDGLGNQMFQYATGFALALHRGVSLRLELSHYRVHNYRRFLLDRFNIRAAPISWRRVAYMTGLGLRGGPKQLSRVMQAVLPGFRHLVYKEKHFHFDPNVLKLPGNVYLSGYWQSEKYFKRFASALRHEFTVRSAPNAKTAELLQLIRNVNSVSVHLRRGDYVSDPRTSQTHGACPVEYYWRAADQIKWMITAPYFFVFSDDIEWAKENLRLNAPTVFVDHNGPSHPEEDLRLMSSCKHHIIANSTFSWWGAWLSDYPEKIVIAPRTWLRRSDLDTRDVVPETWIRL